MKDWRGGGRVAVEATATYLFYKKSDIFWSEIENSAVVETISNGDWMTTQSHILRLAIIKSTDTHSCGYSLGSSGVPINLNTLLMNTQPQPPALSHCLASCSCLQPVCSAIVRCRRSKSCSTGIVCVCVYVQPAMSAVQIDAWEWLLRKSVHLLLTDLLGWKCDKHLVETASYTVPFTILVFKYLCCTHHSRSIESGSYAFTRAIKYAPFSLSHTHKGAQPFPFNLRDGYAYMQNVTEIQCKFGTKDSVRTTHKHTANQS